MKVIIGAFFVPAKSTHPTADQQHKRGQTPQIVRDQYATNLPRPSRQTTQGRAPREHRPEPDDQGQEMDSRKKPVSQHCSTPVSTMVSRPVSSSSECPDLHA